jgi:hypothetical protein
MEPEVREMIEAVLQGKASLDEFQAYLVDLLWDNDDAPDTARAAELVLAEYTGGHRSKTSLGEALRQLIAPVPA